MDDEDYDDSQYPKPAFAMPQQQAQQGQQHQQRYTISDWLVLPTLVFSQFAGTSLWFAPNAVITQVESFEEGQISALASCVQGGFILGTLLLTVFRASDRVSPPLLFAVMTTVGAALNLLCVATTHFGVWAVLRLLVGVCLAGVYPIGMKIAAVEYPSGLGARLGVLVGALTLGTAFPWLVRGIGDETGLPFEATLASVSGLAFVGALLLAVVMLPRDKFQGGFGSDTLRRFFSFCFSTDIGNGQHEEGVNGYGKSESKEGETHKAKDFGKAVSTDSIDSTESRRKGEDSSVPKPDESLPATDYRGLAFLKAIVASSQFRAAAIGYFGHQWELYTMWTFVPVLIDRYSEQNGGVILGNEPMTSFLTIGIGAVSCSVAGVWSLHAGRGILPGSAVVAMVNLMISLGCCLLVPAYQLMSQGVFLFFLLVWGWTVIADSAQFSSLTAMYACKGLLGTSLTLTTCVGYVITVISIQMIGALIDTAGWDPGNSLALLAIGPVIGLFRTYREWPLHRLCRCDNQHKTSTTEQSMVKDSRDDDVESAAGATPKDCR